MGLRVCVCMCDVVSAVDEGAASFLTAAKHGVIERANGDSCECLGLNGVRGGGGRSLKTQLKEEKKKLFTASSE